MNISSLFYASIFLCASFCCGPDDDGFLYYDEEVPDIALIRDNDTLFAVGDTLWFRISVPKVVEVDGETTDISELTGGSEFAYTNFTVFQQNEFENPVPINFSENEIFAQVGTISISSQYIQTTSILETTSFEGLFGLIVKESGSYFITGDEYRDGKLMVSLDTSTSILVSLTSNIVNATPENRYEFVVE